MLAGDIIDRMRANRITADGGAVVPYTSPYNLAIGADPSGGGVPAIDLGEWRTALAAAFPSGTGSVAVANDVTKKVTVVVQWDDSRGAGGSSTQQVTIETRL